MKQASVAASLVALALGCPPVGAPFPDLGDVFRQVAPAVVVVRDGHTGRTPER